MNLPNIPDNLYRLSLVIGLFLLGFAYIKYTNATEAFDKDLHDLIVQSDSFQEKSTELEDEFHSINDTIKKLESRANYYLYLPIDSSNSTAHLNALKSTAKILKQITDSLANYVDKVKQNVTRSGSLVNRMKFANNEIEYQREKVRGIIDERNSFYIIGIALILLGGIRLLIYQRIQDELIKRQLAEKEPYYKYCQSCGKTFTSVLRYGKNHDKTLNKAFCEDCFDNGQFKESNLTIDELKAISLKEYPSKNRFGKSFLFSRLESLDRWKKDKYS